MFAFALALTLAAAPPRGFVAAHSVELITEVDKRLARWLTHEGDRKAMLANEKELEKYFLGLGVKKPDTRAMIAASLEEQGQKAELQQFTAARVLIAYDHKSGVKLHFFDASNRCEVSLLNLGTEAKPRYVLFDGPRTDAKTIDSILERGRASESMLVFAEKKDGAWHTGSLPMPPPPDCTATIKSALKAIYTAERAYFAEYDAYSNSLTKIGVDAKKLGIGSVKVSVAGHAGPDQTFIITVGGLKGGLMTMNEKSDVGVITPCPE